MENNKDLMGWNAPGSNNSSDEEKKREQSSQDPWGRESKFLYKRFTVRSFKIFKRSFRFKWKTFFFKK